MTFTATVTAAVSTATVTLTGTSGSLLHSIQLNLMVEKPVVANGAPTRIRYVRTDATTPYFAYVNENWIVYDPPTQRFFVSDPGTNRIMVMDATTEKEIGTLAVPGAFGLDETPDHTTLYAGTQIGDIYAINPASMTITHRYLASEIGPYGYHSYLVRVLANGSLALLGGQGGIPGVDGYNSFAIWNPTTNSMKIYASNYGGLQLGPDVPFDTVCGAMGNIGAFTLTGDRSKVVVGSIDSDSTLCTVDPATGNDNSVTASGFLTHIAATPDGNFLLLPVYGGNSGQVAVYDAHTLNQVRLIPVAGDTSSAAALLVSADSSTLFITSPGIFYAYNIVTGQPTGWAPNLYVPSIVGGSGTGPFSGPNIQAIDGTGLLAGPMEEGVGFLDATALQVGAVGTQFTNAYLTPATGPVGGGTQTQWGGSGTGVLASVYFGANQVKTVAQSSGVITAVTPAGTAGSADVYTRMQDGGMQILPEAFSYGPSILEATPNAATVQGGGTGMVYGYGFGPTTGNAGIPSGLQISVGGQTAVITAFNPGAYGVAPSPFPLQSLAYTVPAGTGSADITVTTPSGSATVSGGMDYLPDLQQFPLNGAALAQGIYDPVRDIYYFTDASEIQVFSRTQGHWLSPIQVPAVPGGAHRLWGVALSPDGSKLAVSDAQAGVIYLINPSISTSVQTFSLPATVSGTITNPCGLAISDAGIVYYATFTQYGDDFLGYHKLDTGSGKVTDYNIANPGNYGEDAYLRAAISADNTRVFFNNDGAPFSIDTATDKTFWAADGPGCCYGDYDLTLSSDQTRMEATSYLYDTNLDGDAAFGLNDRETLDIGYVYGTKLSADGSLVFQPTTNGIDVIDGRLATCASGLHCPLLFRRITMRWSAMGGTTS